jgi:hypothetical protein
VEAAGGGGTRAEVEAEVEAVGTRDEAAHGVITQYSRASRRESGLVEALLLELGDSPDAALMATPSRPVSGRSISALGLVSYSVN